MQDQLTKLKHLMAEEKERQDERANGLQRYNDANLNKGIGEIKDIISTMALAHPTAGDA